MIDRHTAKEVCITFMVLIPLISVGVWAAKGLNDYSVERERVVVLETKDALRKFLYSMRDMETSLMQIFPGSIPIQAVTLRPDVYFYVLGKIREVNPYLEETEKYDDRRFEYGSLTIIHGQEDQK